MAPTSMRALCDSGPFKPSRGPKTVFPEFDPSPRNFTDLGMAISYNQDIPMRDGVRLRADIFHPVDHDGKLGIVLAITPYGKQNPFDVSKVPISRDFNPGLDGVIQSKYAVFEGSDPVFWTKRKFAYVVVDSRGSFASEGDKANFLSKADGEDGLDTVEYLASLSWSNGKIGMIGASALGAIQWHTAALRPPHLSALLVQDAYTNETVDDMYRSHGNVQGAPILDLAKACELHPYYDEFWELYTPDIEKIECPMYVISSLADNGIHTPGTIRGWLAARSEMKFLELHPYLKWEWQLTWESLERQAAFFNRFLDGRDTHAAESTKFWPKVRLHVTDKHYSGSWRSEDSWPLKDTHRTKYFLGPNNALSPHQAPASGSSPSVQYDSLTGSTSWTVQFAAATEITGSAKLHLRFAVGDGATDADLFVTLQKRDRDGRVVVFPFHTFINDGHVAYGWLRASQRALDSKSFGDEVAHTHRKEDVRLLKSHEPVDLDINIQPSATLFRTGETLVVVVQGHDFGEYSEWSQIPRAGTGINQAGTHTVFLDGSYVELPVISRKA